MSLMVTQMAQAQDLPIPAERPEVIVTEPGKPGVEQAAVKPLRDLTCEKRLAEMGVKFRIMPSENGAGGCGVAYPVAIDALANGVAVKPETKLDCSAAEALAQWVDKSLIPALAVLGPDKKLTSIVQASTYVCRSRNNQKGAKLSEHAKGNAIDITAFEFSDGTRIGIEPRDRKGSDEEAFQKAIRFGGCLYFTTVLGPGSDAFHNEHLHLDVAERRGGYRLCRFPE